VIAHCKGCAAAASGVYTYKQGRSQGLLHMCKTVVATACVIDSSTG